MECQSLAWVCPLSAVGGALLLLVVQRVVQCRSGNGETPAGGDTSASHKRRWVKKSSSGWIETTIEKESGIEFPTTAWGELGESFGSKFATPKRFVFFLSHYKAEAGGIARLIKANIEKMLPEYESGNPCYLDSDNLTSLAKLFRDGIRLSEGLMIIATAGTFSRPYCLAEMYVASKLGLPCLLVIVDGMGFDLSAARRMLRADDDAFKAHLDAQNPGAHDELKRILRHLKVVPGTEPHAEFRNVILRALELDDSTLRRSTPVLELFSDAHEHDPLNAASRLRFSPNAGRHTIQADMIDILNDLSERTGRTPLSWRGAGSEMVVRLTMACEQQANPPRAAQFTDWPPEPIHASSGGGPQQQKGASPSARQSHSSFVQTFGSSQFDAAGLPSSPVANAPAPASAAAPSSPLSRRPSLVERLTLRRASSAATSVKNASSSSLATTATADVLSRRESRRGSLDAIAAQLTGRRPPQPSVGDGSGKCAGKGNTVVPLKSIRLWRSSKCLAGSSFFVCHEGTELSLKMADALQLALRYYQGESTHVEVDTLVRDDDVLTALHTIRQADAIILLLTEGVLLQPRCLLLLYAARRIHVPIVPVAVEDGGYVFNGAWRCLTQLASRLSADAHSHISEKLEDIRRELRLSSIWPRSTIAADEDDEGSAGAAEEAAARLASKQVSHVGETLARYVPSLISVHFRQFSSATHRMAVAKDVVQRVDWLHEEHKAHRSQVQVVTPTNSERERAQSAATAAGYGAASVLGAVAAQSVALSDDVWDQLAPEVSEVETVCTMGELSAPPKQASMRLSAHEHSIREVDEDADEADPAENV